MLEVKLDYGSSMVWRSIVYALDLLKERLTWKVGNGKQIRIWGDNWLLNPSNYCVQSPIKLLPCDSRVLPSDSRVTESIDNEFHCWKEEVINEIFLQDEAEHICYIPINKMGADNKLIWGRPYKKWYIYCSKCILCGTGQENDDKRRYFLFQCGKWGLEEFFGSENTRCGKKISFALNNILPTKEIYLPDRLLKINFVLFVTEKRK